MRPIFCLLFLASSFYSSSAFSTSFYDGNKLKEWADAIQRLDGNRGSSGDYQLSAQIGGYVAAVAETYDGDFFCLPEHVRLGQLVAVVSMYVTSHPEKWNTDARLLVMFSLRAAFPCKK